MFEVDELVAACVACLDETDVRRAGWAGRWWWEALDWVVVNDEPNEFEIRSEPHRPPGLLFVPVPEAKTINNRLHLDFRPASNMSAGDSLRVPSTGSPAR
jgi:hypothetical protein